MGRFYSACEFDHSFSRRGISQGAFQLSASLPTPFKRGVRREPKRLETPCWGLPKPNAATDGICPLGRSGKDITPALFRAFAVNQSGLNQWLKQVERPLPGNVQGIPYFARRHAPLVPQHDKSSVSQVFGQVLNVSSRWKNRCSWGLPELISSLISLSVSSGNQ